MSLIHKNSKQDLQQTCHQTEFKKPISETFAQGHYILSGGRTKVFLRANESHHKSTSYEKSEGSSEKN